MKNEILDNIFKNFLDGKKATVSSGSLDCSASIEGDVWLEYNSNFGLYCLTTLQWNTYKIEKELLDKIRESKIGYDNLEKVHKNINEVINNFKIRIGQVTSYNAKDFKIIMEDKNIRYVYITYKDDSTTKIRINR